jgi:hypothetical protein
MAPLLAKHFTSHGTAYLNRAKRPEVCLVRGRVRQRSAMTAAEGLERCRISNRIILRWQG